jgi:hypothetical protein
MNWSAIYDILQTECGATDYWRENFCYAMQEQDCREYRFQGSLGFGGKLYNNHGKLHVSCYREDETPERLAAIDRANNKLKACSR